jgi:Arc/MetJ family transcription regulator
MYSRSMRTTLTLDDDVVALLGRVREGQGLGLKQAVNEALRRGLRQMAEPAQRRTPYHTASVSLGRCLVGSLDDVAEALAVAEGEAFR